MLSHKEKHGGQPLYISKPHEDAEQHPQHNLLKSNEGEPMSLEDFRAERKRRKREKKKERRAVIVDEEKLKRRENLVHKINEEGVWFKSYRDGTLTSLTPESSVEYQKAFGADIIIPLDELPPPHCDDKERLIASLHRTHRY